MGDNTLKIKNEWQHTQNKKNEWQHTQEKGEHYSSRKVSTIAQRKIYK
jgi:hypothetical protein